MSQIVKRILIVIYFQICFCCVQVKPQVCEGTKIGYRWNTKNFTLPATYTRKCSFSTCRFTRQRMISYTRPVLKTFIKKTKICCNGYSLTGWLSSEEPICEPSCPNGCYDGYCARPNFCVCNKGYTKDEFDKCTPNSSRRNRRYRQRRNISPGPNLIRVSRIDDDEDDYDASSESSTCSTECENGMCVSGMCICRFGYRKIMNTCIATCNSECINSFCSYPSLTCECYSGYTLVNNTCKPNCKYGCQPGTCESTNSNCKCSDGFYKRFDDCIAECSPECGNGLCTAPNTCDCYPGYKLADPASSEGSSTFMCVPECENCNGSCIAPNQCIIKCSPPYETVQTNEDSVYSNDNSLDIREVYATVCRIQVTETNITHEETKNDYFYWVIGASSIGVILVVILVLIAARKYLANCCKRKNDNLGDKNNENSNGETHNLGTLKTVELN